MGGKKWCQYCRINIPYSRKDIQDHEATRLHLQNKQKSIQFQRNKIRKQRQQNKKSKQQVMLGTANIPKAKKGSQLQKQIQSYRQSVIQQGKNAIHRMIALRTQGLLGAPIQYPDKQDLVLAQNYQNSEKDSENDSDKNYQMWKIDICQKTGQACFINRITKLVLYQPPKGYVLSQQQKQQWEYLKQICKEKVQINPDAHINITQWEQVPQQQNYFEINKAQNSNDQDQQQNQQINKNGSNNINYSKYIKNKNQTEYEEKTKKQENIQKPKTFRQQLQQKLINNQISTNQVFQKFIEYEMKNSKTVKQKNQNLKKLIQSGLQIRRRPSDDLINELNNNPNVKLEDKPKVTFKARKKVQQNVQILQEKDIF